jgi:hypothetical protein
MMALATAAMLTLLASTVAAQTLPAPPPATASQPSTRPRNLDKALEDEVTFEFKDTRLEDAIATMRQTTQTNIAVNWPALALSGITRDTPVTLRLSKVTYEQAVRSLIEQLPATKSRPNYLVGENALEITTTADLGKQTVPKLFPVGRLLSISLAGESTPEQRAANAEFLRRILHTELRSAGEDVDREGRKLEIKNNLLVAEQSRRGLLYIQQTLWRFSAPVRIGEQVPGTRMSVQGRKAEQRMNELVGNGENREPLIALAKDPGKVAPELNVILLPGTHAILEKDPADATPPPELDYTITEGGVVLIGPAADIRGRIMLVVYDLKDLLKRMAFKNKQKPPPSPAELADSILTQLQAKVPAGRHKGAAWGEIGKAPSAMARYENLLVVVASPAVHRGVAAGLQELYR